MHVLKKVGIAGALIASAAISLSLAGPASADTGAEGTINGTNGGDAVFVGSDTLQNAVNFVLDGSPGVAGGYNGGNLNRAVSYDANGDANGRATYDGTCKFATTDSSTNTTTTTTTVSGCDNTSLVVNSGTKTTKVTVDLLAASVVLRAGTNPVTRPNGSGGGVGALIADGGAGYQGLPTSSIQVARMSRLPKSSEVSSCAAAANCGTLNSFQVATDGLTVVHQKSAYNGPAALSINELVGIYSCTTTQWNQLPGNSSGSTDTIHPLLPPSTSGTATFFLQDLATAAGTSSFTPGSCVSTVQEHDPSGIATDPTPADAIEPFSIGKLALLNKGYFQIGATGATTAGIQAAFAPNYLTAVTGTAGDGNPSYLVNRGLFLTVRTPDLASTVPFQPGGTQNWSSALITDPFSAFRGANGRSELAYAGLVTTSGGVSTYKPCATNATTTC